MSEQTTRNISLTPDLAAFVEEIDAAGEFTSVSEYFRQLLRDDRERRYQRRIDELLIEGIESGDATEVTWDEWEEKKRFLIQRARELRAKEHGDTTQEDPARKAG